MVRNLEVSIGQLENAIAHSLAHGNMYKNKEGTQKY